MIIPCPVPSLIVFVHVMTAAAAAVLAARPTMFLSFPKKTKTNSIYLFTKTEQEDGGKDGSRVI